MSSACRRWWTVQWSLIIKALRRCCNVWRVETIFLLGMQWERPTMLQWLWKFTNFVWARFKSGTRFSSSPMTSFFDPPFFQVRGWGYLRSWERLRRSRATWAGRWGGARTRQRRSTTTASSWCCGSKTTPRGPSTRKCQCNEIYRDRLKNGP